MVNYVTELLLEMAYAKPKHPREDDTVYHSEPADRIGGSQRPDKESKDERTARPEPIEARQR
jgi:hypothetical protein